MADIDIGRRIADLEEALGSGQLTIESQGDRLTYRSTRELREAIRYFQDKLDAARPSGSGFGFSAVGHSRD